MRGFSVSRECQARGLGEVLTIDYSAESSFTVIPIIPKKVSTEFTIERHPRSRGYLDISLYRMTSGPRDEQE